MRGLCIDPRWDGGTPNAKIAGLYRAERYVLQPTLWGATSDYINGGTYVRGVLARESGDPAQYAGWGPPNFDITIGNEPDGSGASSWTMSPDEYGALWDETSDYAAPRWIAGMCSGDVARAADYVARAPGAAGLNVHLYLLGPDAAISKLNEYRSLGLPLRVGEWHPADGFRLGDYAWPSDVDVNDFCLSDAMVSGLGLYA